ncbi:MAG: hypothetical protein HYT64_02105 [Candidatus Yanofskybacteria bacterium]|nr:hypothetical protein [Candidatus Yanofskybacteria bacterium]
MKSEDIKIIILMAVILILALYVSPFLPDPLQYKVPAKEDSWIFRLGTPNHDYDDLLKKIKKDINHEEVNIKILIGPYFENFGIQGQLMRTDPLDYVILADKVFYDWLSAEEKIVLIAHETGHIIFSSPGKMDFEKITGDQVLADTFAAKYVESKYLITFLDKLYSDYLIRLENAKKLAKDR